MSPDDSNPPRRGRLAFLLPRRLADKLDALRSKYLPRGSLRGSLASGTFWSMFSNGFMNVSALVGSILIARVVGKYGYGLWGLIVTAVTFFVSFTRGGLGMTATKYIAELRQTDPARAGRIIMLILTVSSTMIVIVSCAVILFSPWLASWYFKQPELAGPLMLSVLWVAAMTISFVLQGTVAGFQDFRGVAVSNMVQGITFLLAIVPLGWFFRLPGAIAAMAISHGAMAIVCARLVVTKCRSNGITLSARGIFTEMGVLIHYMLPAVLTAVLINAAGLLSQGYVARFPNGVEVLGSFKAANGWLGYVLIVPNAIGQVVMPILANLKGRGENQRLRKAVWVSVILIAAVGMVMAAPLMILSPWIMGFYGHAFKSDWAMLVVLAGVGVVQAIGGSLANVTTAVGRMWFYFMIHIVWFALMTCGTILMVPSMGAWGYIWAFAITNVVHTMLYALIVILNFRRPQSPLKEVPFAESPGLP